MPRHIQRIVIGLSIIAAVSGCAATPSSARAATFYVSPHGHDSRSGKSSRLAWRTVGRVNAARLRPGDTVRFQGGRTFSDATLTPRSSGMRPRRITFTSYGAGRATIAHPNTAVWFSGRSGLVFDRLSLTTNNTPGAVFSGSPSGASSYITIRRCVLWNTAGVGINSPTRGDSHWVIRDNRISHTGDSGIILLGSHDRVSGNTISDTGWNSSIQWDKHGVYVKGPEAVIRRNRITDFQSSGLSLRLNDAVVTGNTIQGGKFGIAYFDYSTSVGTSYIRLNRMNAVEIGFYISPDPDHNDGSRPRENFDVTKNVFRTTGDLAIDLTGGRYSEVKFAHNSVFADGALGLAGLSPIGGKYLEHDNRFHGPLLFSWNGLQLPYLAYRSASGQGARDSFLSGP